MNTYPYNQGRNDSNKGLGQRPPQSFGSDTFSKSYQAGWHHANDNNKPMQQQGNKKSS